MTRIAFNPSLTPRNRPTCTCTDSDCTATGHVIAIRIESAERAYIIDTAHHHCDAVQRVGSRCTGCAEKER